MVIAYFASDFEPGVSVKTVVEAVWAGAASMWEGQVRWRVTDTGIPVFEFSALIAGEEVVCETFSPIILGSNGRVCLVTAVLQAPIRAPQLGEHLHRSINKHLNARPAEPLTGDEARAVLEKRQSELIVFGAWEDTEPVPPL